MSDVTRRLVAQLAAGGFVSGEAVAANLRISRAAVNQHVERLRERGVEIHGVRGRGYRLARPLEMLDETRIRSLLSPCPAARLASIEILDAVDSTNRRIRECWSSGIRLDACFAEYQVAGRGRRGRAWLAAPYGSVLMSVAHELPGGPAASAGLSLAAGVAAARAVAHSCGTDLSLKWPNDLVVGGAKCGGILVEIAGELGERCLCVVGVGLNVTLPPGLAAQCDQPATGLSDHAAARVSRNALAAALLCELVEVLGNFSLHGFAPLRGEWISRHVNQDRPVRVVAGDSTIAGVARGADVDGALLVEEPHGVLRRITTGEVMA